MSSTPGSPSDSPTATDVVYGELGGVIVLIRRSDAEELAAVREAVHASTTWGDLRTRLPPARSAQLAEAFGDDEDRPGDDVALVDEPAAWG